MAVLAAAEEWHIPPWRLVEECTAEWWAYFGLWTAARSGAARE